MAYEFKASDVWNFSETIRTEKKQKGNELFFKRCPYCNGGGHDDDTFSINLENGTFNCFRAGCGKHGHFVELARDFGFQLDFGTAKQYRRLPQREVIVKPEAVKYLETRGIGQATAEKYRITTKKNDDTILVFPFYDETNELVFVKYRNTRYSGKGNKEWCERETKPILFGMAQCRGFDRLVITEGQMDSLSLSECGIQNAVSVPTGAMGFTWLTNCWDWIIKFRECVVFGDFEKGKMTLIDELQKRLPMKVKAVRQQDYLGEKDANDILTKYGREAILTAVENAEVPPVKNVKELADVKAVDLNTLPKIKTNIAEVDKIIGGLCYGQVVLLTGKRGEGKSTFLSQLIVEAIEQDIPVFAYSGELTDYHFKRWLDFQAAGPNNVEMLRNEFNDEIYTIPDNVVEKINQWYRGKAYIYDNNYLPQEKEEFESLLETVEKAVKQYGIKLICIDNLMTALDISLSDDLYRAQSAFVRNLKLLAVKYDAVVVLVAHPRKSRDKFDNDDVSGSADITNRVDVVMNYSRPDGGDEEKNEGLLKITKNRLTGRLEMNGIKLYYSASTKRITGFTRETKHYGWERGFDRYEAELDTLPF